MNEKKKTLIVENRGLVSGWWSIQFQKTLKILKFVIKKKSSDCLEYQAKLAFPFHLLTRINGARTFKYYTYISFKTRSLVIN